MGVGAMCAGNFGAAAHRACDGVMTGRAVLLVMLTVIVRCRRHRMLVTGMSGSRRHAEHKSKRCRHRQTGGPTSELQKHATAHVHTGNREALGMNLRFASPPVQAAT